MSKFDLRTVRQSVALYRSYNNEGDFWRHNKTGNLYWIQNIGIQEKDGEPLVIYREMIGNIYWVRPAKEFFDGRFEKVEFVGEIKWVK